MGKKSKRAAAHVEFLPLADTTQLPACQCLDCGRTISAASTTNPKKPLPREGDVTVCLYCGCLMFFTHSLQVRRPSSEEIAEMQANHLEVWDEILYLQRKFRNAAGAFVIGGSQPKKQ